MLNYCKALEKPAVDHGLHGSHGYAEVGTAVPAVRERRAIYHETDESGGYRVTYLPVDRDGLLTLADLVNAITDETAVVSLMWANNETGYCSR